MLKTQQLKWTINKELIIKFKKSGLDEFYHSDIYGIWTICIVPNGWDSANKGQFIPFLNLIGLPQNVLKIKAKSKITINEFNKIVFVNTHKFTYNKSWNWSLEYKNKLYNRDLMKYNGNSLTITWQRSWQEHGKDHIKNMAKIIARLYGKITFM